MKRLLVVLAGAVVASAAVSCTSEVSENTESSTRFTTVAPSDSSQASESDTSEEGPRPTTNTGENTDSDLEKRSPDEFIDTETGNSAGTVYGVRSPDERVACLVDADEDFLRCDAFFADPPLYPQNSPHSWKSNNVWFEPEKGFFPAVAGGLVSPGPVTLEPGNTVTIGSFTFEALSGDEFTVTNGEHHFTVKNEGEYYSDTFPPTPDADGRADIGTICGQIPGEGNVYVMEDGTDCNRAMDAMKEYMADSTGRAEGGQRQIRKIGEVWCSFSAPSNQQDIPENRHFGCSLDGGGSVVLL